MTRGWVMVLLLAACGSSDPSAPEVRGMYRVTHHTLAQASSAADLVSCASEGPDATTPIAYFRLSTDEFFGHGIMLEECDDAAGTGCAERFGTFFEERDDGWETIGYNTQTGGGTECNLYHSRYRITVNDDGTVTVMYKEWFATSTADACDLDDAEALGSEPDCMLHEVLIGEVVP